MRYRFIFLLLAAAISISLAKADPLVLQSPARQVSLLELFTSEGCSSCPPADRWLSGLTDDARLWREVVPVAFHVDYWDYIGWPDRFADRAYTDRQRAHARNWSSGTVYTPGLVLNGEEWRGWFRDPSLELKADGEAVGVLRLEIDGDTVTARFSPPTPTAEPLELHLTILGFGLETAVKAGENRGRTLTHDFVVLGHRRLPLTAAAAGYETQAALPAPRLDAAKQALAAWVSRPGNPRPLQAVGGWL